MKILITLIYLFTSCVAFSQDIFSRNGQSASIYYLSAYSTLNAGPGDTGNDNTAALQGLLDLAAPGKPIRIVVDGNIRIGLIRIHGNTELVGVGWPTVYYKYQDNRSVIRNYNPPVTASSYTIVDSNITISGLIIQGNGANQIGSGAGDATYVRKEANGTLLCGIQMYGVKNLHIYDMKIVDIKTIAIHVWGKKLNFHNIDFDNDQARLAQGGLIIEGHTSEVKINNISGSSYDDLIATETDSDQLLGNLGPWVGSGPITDVVASNIVASSCYTVWRFCTLGGVIDRINVSNVSGQFWGFGIVFSSVGFHGPNYGSITFNKFNVAPVFKTVPPEFGGSSLPTSLVFVNDSDIKNLTITSSNISPTDTRDIVHIDGATSIKLLKIDLDVTDFNSAAQGAVPIRIQGNVQAFVFSGNWIRGGSTVSNEMIRNEGTISNLIVKTTSANLCKYLINNVGTITNMQASGINHTAGGTGTATARTTSNVSKLSLSNWIGTTQVEESGGVFTTKTGDGF